MKVNEIQIGDWVMVNDIEHTHPLQVAEIFKKCGAYYATLYWDGMPDNSIPDTLSADIDKIEPVHLTPEILEKNGWEKRPTGYVFYTDGKRYDNSFWYIFGSSTFVVNTAEFQIKFVHQLQHALRLCGIEKEIVL